MLKTDPYILIIILRCVVVVTFCSKIDSNIFFLCSKSCSMLVLSRYEYRNTIRSEYNSYTYKLYHWLAKYFIDVTIGTSWDWWVEKIQIELRQYRNDSIQSKNFLVLKLPRFFTRWQKSAAISKHESFWLNWVVPIY